MAKKQNKVNVTKFQEMLRKGTCNFSIDNIGITFTKDNYHIGMKNNNCILIIDKDNDIINNIGKDDEWSLNFYEPVKNVKTYFSLIEPDENDEVNIKMMENKISIQSGRQKSQLFFCSEHLISSFNGTGPKTNGDEICSFKLDEDFIYNFETVKRIASTFGKIYFTIEDGKLFIEGTDKTNTFSNGIKIEIGKSDYEDVTVCFDFKTFNNVITIINGDFEDFEFRIGYVKKSGGGLISIINEDESEKYYILSMREVM
jgi:hypothetical protein